MWDSVLPYCRYRTDIDKAACLTVREGEGQLRFVKFKSFAPRYAGGWQFRCGGYPSRPDRRNPPHQLPLHAHGAKYRPGACRYERKCQTKKKKGRSKRSLSDFVAIDAISCAPWHGVRSPLWHGRPILKSVITTPGITTAELLSAFASSRHLLAFQKTRLSRFANT